MSTTLVLAVDDEPALLKLTEHALKQGGYAVLTFDDARDALEEMRDGLRPDVIVSDIHMPAMTGFEFYEHVRQIGELRAVPFLFLTALEDRANMRRGMTLGADDYLTKPVRTQELLEAVEVRLRRIAELRKPLEGVVSALGLGHPVVSRDGERLDWESLKALELLFYLLEHRSGATTFEVAEALWPGKTEAKASSSFHTTLYRLRKVMGGELVESANRRYYLQDRFTIEYDVDQYRALAKRARDSRLAADYRTAVDRYTGHFMTGFEGAWVEDLREFLCSEQLALLHAAAAAARGERDLDGATQLFRRMTEHEPYSELAWSGLADVWEERGDRVRAGEVRARFERLMDEG
ncbi:MAG: response regulator [Trueperaceae bacterium]|nr:response regulator [Trueperaceae bacterium]